MLVAIVAVARRRQRGAAEVASFWNIHQRHR